MTTRATLATLAPLAAVTLLALSCASPGRRLETFPPYTDPIRDITLHNGRPGYAGLEVGMTFREAEAALGRRLPSLVLDPRESLCGFAAVDVAPRRQPLQLEFDSAGGENGRLMAIWLLLVDRNGNATTAHTAKALRARFPDLVYVPSRQVPEPEATNPQPLYRAPGGALFLIDPRLGVYFGNLCLASATG